MFPVAADESDELALSAEFAQSLMATVVPGISPLRDRACHALQGAPAGREDVPARPRVPGRRRRPHQQSARRHGHERRHPRRDQPDLAPGRCLARTKADAELDALRPAAPAGDARIHRDSSRSRTNATSSPTATEFRRTLREIAADRGRYLRVPAAGLHDRELAPRAGAGRARSVHLHRDFGRRRSTSRPHPSALRRIQDEARTTCLGATAMLRSSAGRASPAPPMAAALSTSPAHGSGRTETPRRSHRRSQPSG